MYNFLNIFLPNKNISNKTMLLLILGQAIAFLILWLYSPFVFLPTVTETLKAFSQLWSEGVFCELITSLKLNLQAIVLATAVTLILAYSTVIPFFRPIVTILSKLRFLSLVGLTFFFTLLASNGHELKLYLLVFSISVFFVTSMSDVLDSIPRVQFDLARTLRMGEWRLIWEVIVLGQIDKVFEVLRQNAAMSWMVLTLVEGMDRSDGGIGTLLLNNSKHFHLSAIMAIQILILFVGLGQDYLLGLLRNIICPYASLLTEKK